MKKKSPVVGRVVVFIMSRVCNKHYHIIVLINLLYWKNINMEQTIKDVIKIKNKSI